MSVCRHCGEPVRYVRMRSGKRNPCQPEPDDERGNILVQGGIGRVLNADAAADARAAGYDLYLSHFAVCEKAAAEQRKPPKLPENVIPLDPRRRARPTA